MIVVDAVALASLVVLVIGSRVNLLSLLFQQFVERFLYAASNQFFDLVFEYFLCNLRNLFYLIEQELYRKANSLLISSTRRVTNL